MFEFTRGVLGEQCIGGIQAVAQIQETKGTMDAHHKAVWNGHRFKIETKSSYKSMIPLKMFENS